MLLSPDLAVLPSVLVLSGLLRSPLLHVWAPELWGFAVSCFSPLMFTRYSLTFCLWSLNINLLVQNQKHSFPRPFSGPHRTIVYILFLDISSRHRAIFSTDFDPSSLLLGPSSSIFGMTFAPFRKKMYWEKQFYKTNKDGYTIDFLLFPWEGLLFFYFYTEVNAFCSGSVEIHLLHPNYQELRTLTQFRCTKQPRLFCIWLLTHRKWAQDAHGLHSLPLWSIYWRKGMCTDGEGLITSLTNNRRLYQKYFKCPCPWVKNIF